MYKAKDNGGNGYFFYESSMTQKAFAQIKMEEAFIHAFRNHEFEIYYLPQYDMENRSIKSVEALVRWRHPMRGFLAPDEFLPYIEKLNLLYRLDKWMMNSAMKDFVKWKKMGIAPEKLSLNIRMAELANEQWERKVLKTMKRLSFESSWLELEISEREIMKHPDRVVALLDSMHRHGISIVIDDFGTGYSSIKQLKALPIDKIKIDKSLVVDLIVDEESLFMSNIIIAVAKSMGVAIMAEGVETEAQAKILSKHGCSYAQGYYYSKPMSREEIVGCLSEAKRLNS
jgi:EAL domain-containing protein (putative c-di-GMP-specific phosphodiesterase class I)